MDWEYDNEIAFGGIVSVGVESEDGFKISVPVGRHTRRRRIDAMHACH